MESFELPSFPERLQELYPTKEILNFYRRRLAESESDESKILKRLEEFKQTCESQHCLEKSLLDRDEEISSLRKALSDIQACLYQEREHVLRLYAENDRLKIRELDDREKIRQLLMLCGEKYPSADLFYIMKDQPEFDVLRAAQKKGTTNMKSQTRPKNNSKSSSCNFETKAVNQYEDATLLKLQIQALRTEMEDQARLSRENIEALSEDCRITREEADAQLYKHTQKIVTLTNKIKFSQDLLQRMTKDFLDLKRQNSQREQIWLKQRDNLTMKVGTIKKKVSSATNLHLESPPVIDAIHSSHGKKSNQLVQTLQSQLEKVSKLVDTYKTQCSKLEEELSALKEEKESCQTLLIEKSERLSNQLRGLQSKYKELERKQKFEVEGFKNDVKILRTQLQKSEKQLLKMAISLTQTQSDQEILQSIHGSSSRSKYVADNLRELKNQIYQLEQDLNHI